MSQFFKRYIPPPKTSVASKTNSEAPPPAEKRRRQDPVNTGAKKRKIQHTGISDDNASQSQNAVEASRNIVSSGRDILNKYSVSRTARSFDEDVAITHKKKQNQSKKIEVADKNEDDTSLSSGDSNSDSDSASQESVLSDDEKDNDNKKHAGVLRKYDKSKRWSRVMEVQEDDIDTGGHLDLHIRDLVPIPQPVIETNFEPKEPTYSTLPIWQAAPTTVGPSQAVGFDTLGLSDRMLSNLRSHDIHTALPVQGAAIPLLMQEKAPRQQRDLCISAATGSGKTLAYVIPIIEHLRKRNKPGLQAVIVAPTRELIKQVRRICELCALGSTLNIVTALAGQSLRKERETLVEEYEVYDPKAYQAELRAPIDWKTFDLQQILERGLRLAKDPSKIKDHVTRTRIKADILITTPGRLVDHLQETPGFHLDDVDWLVVDEADRLLSESYQDWIDVVVPALQSTRATQERDKILTYMRRKPPPRVVRKILLSATMTEDLSKLNQIGLVDPQMIVLKSPGNDSSLKATTDTDQPVTDNAGKYALPEYLKEVAVCFKDGTEKPLILLQLLQKHINATSQEDLMVSKAMSSSDDDSSYDSTSSSGDSSESESEDSSSDTSSSALSEESSPRRKQSSFIDPPRRLFIADTSSHARSLIFTRSTEGALRLSRLLSMISPGLKERVTTLTRSTTSSSTSRKALSSFRSGKTPVLIATDRASRGIDIPGLENVISYDVPGSAVAYIHRVGRTARAGKEGYAWTLVEHREGRWFWNEIGGKDSKCTIRRRDKVKKMTMTVDSDDTDLIERYEKALADLGSEVRGE